MGSRAWCSVCGSLDARRDLYDRTDAATQSPGRGSEARRVVPTDAIAMLSALQPPSLEIAAERELRGASLDYITSADGDDELIEY